MADVRTGAACRNEGEDATDSGFSDEDRGRLARLRSELLRSLPTDIRRARKAYHRVARDAADVMDAKGIVNHQAACKAALAHVESLIKLLRWVCDEDLAAEPPVRKNGTKDIADSAHVAATEQGGDEVSQLILAARTAMQSG
ncbi:hypothetical protein [Thalassospira sp.]|uniref:hypothetical protein n=1 Tax=Thalassospira sp. TaxID=1912094 RepID=UPI003AA7C069